jgi:hypothetical protein
MSTPASQIRLPRLAARLGEAAVERARLTVVPRRRTRAARVPFVTLVSLVLLGGVVGLLLFNTSMQQASFAATDLQAQVTNLNARQQTLMMELDTLRDPQRVAQRAVRLGMVSAGTPAFLDLGSNSIVGIPTPATRENKLSVKAPPPHLPAALNPPPLVHKVYVDPPSPQHATTKTGKSGDTPTSTHAPSGGTRSHG